MLHAVGILNWNCTTSQNDWSGKSSVNVFRCTTCVQSFKNIGEWHLSSVICEKRPCFLRRSIPDKPLAFQWILAVPLVLTAQVGSFEIRCGSEIRDTSILCSFSVCIRRSCAALQLFKLACKSLIIVNIIHMWKTSMSICKYVNTHTSLLHIHRLYRAVPAYLLYSFRKKLTIFLYSLKTKLRAKFCKRKNRLRIHSRIWYFKDKRLFRITMYMYVIYT